MKRLIVVIKESHKMLLQLSGNYIFRKLLDKNSFLILVNLDNQVLMDYIIDDLGGVIGEQYEDPYGEGRIVIVETAE